MLQKTEEEHYPIVGHDGVWIPARLPEGVPVWPTVAPAPTVRITIPLTMTWGQRLWLWQYESTTYAGWLLLCAVERVADGLLHACSRLCAWLERR